MPLARTKPPRLQHASADAFRAGILLSIGLALAGAAVAAVGISNVRPESAGLHGRPPAVG